MTLLSRAEALTGPDRATAVGRVLAADEIARKAKTWLPLVVGWTGVGRCIYIKTTVTIPRAKPEPFLAVLRAKEGT